MGQNLGPILQVERNGNSATTAVSLKKVKTTGIDKIINKTYFYNRFIKL
ncbi:hypothetical protein [Chryseobacterium indoltheticum]